MFIKFKNFFFFSQFHKAKTTNNKAKDNLNILELDSSAGTSPTSKVS